MKIKKGDKVKILSGKDRGREGEVLRVIPKEAKVVVSGLNIVKRTTPKTQERAGGFVEVEAPLHISKVSVVCPKCKKPTRIGKGRVCKNCGAKL
ncbi:50S ribosomal protein L24 [Candidatus Saccharibacteria bacterium]|nr:50S ribosomal protein L24 [Candidatus Saccharibacteria bacterium]